MPATTLKRARRVARRVLWATTLGELARLGALAAFVLGTLALVLRGAFDVPRATAAWVLAPLALVPVLAFLRARRRRIGAEEAAIWLDVRAGSTGLILADLELSDPRWRARTAELLTAAASPPVRLGPAAGRLAAGAAFALAAVWIALPARASATAPTALFTAAIERLAGRLDTLQELVDLDPALATELAERLERMRAKVEDAEPEGLFEAMDRFEERLGSEAETLADLAQRAEQGMALAQRLAALDPEAARAGLESALAKLQESGLAGQLARTLGERLGEMEGIEGLGDLAQRLGDSLELPQGLELEPEELARLAEEMRKTLGGRGAELLRSGLLDGDALERLREARRLGDELLRGAGERGGLAGLAKLAGLAGLELGGDGTSEGPGSPPLWGEESPEREALFEATPLPAARFADPERSARLDERGAAPLVAAEGESAGLVEVEASAGEAAWRRRLAPRHRAAVRAFFAPGSSSVPDTGTDTGTEDRR